MAAILSPSAKQQFFTNAGEPAAGYALYTYAANTTNPRATYTNRAGTVANTNPIILDARGEAIIYLTPGVVYDYVLKTGSGALVWTREDVIADAGDANAVSFLQAGTGAVTRSMQDKGRDRLSVLDFIPTQELRDAIRARTTVAGDKAVTVAAIQAAINAANERGGVAVYLPAGKYWADGLDISGMDNLVIVGDGPNATEIVSDSATATVFTSNAEGRYRRFSGFSISSSVTRTSGHYFYMANERRTVWENLRLTGWFHGITVPVAEMSYIDRCFITTPSGAGDSVTLGTASSPGQVSGFIMFDCFLRGTDDVLGGLAVGRYGVICYDVDALYIVNTDIGGYVEGNLLISPASRAANIHALQSFFDATKNNDCARMAGAGTKMQISFTGCWFASAGKLTGGNVEACCFRALNEGAYQDIVFTGCRFYSAAGSGVLIESPGADFNFSGGTIYSNGALAVGNRHGFKWIPATTATVGPSINGVRFAGNATKDIYIGANGNAKHSIQGVHLDTGIDHLAIAGRIDGFDPTSSTYASATTLTISPFHNYARITGTTNITGMTPTYNGHLVTLKFDGALIVIDASTNLSMAGSFNTVAGSILTLRCDGASWWEVARANT